MFAVNRAARRFEALTAQVLAADDLGFLEGLVLAAMFLKRRGRSSHRSWRRHLGLRGGT